MKKLEDEIKNHTRELLKDLSDRQITQTLKLYSLIISNKKSDIKMTTREIFYQGVNVFKTQSAVISIIKKIEKRFQCTRDDMNITASLKGLVYGKVKFFMNNNNEYNGILIPDIDKIKRIETSCKYIIVVEKDSIFSILVQLMELIVNANDNGLNKRIIIDKKIEKLKNDNSKYKINNATDYTEKTCKNNSSVFEDIDSILSISDGNTSNNAPEYTDNEFTLNNSEIEIVKSLIIVCGKGYPCHNTLKFLKRMSSITIYGIFDYDPYGLHIYLNYKKHVNITRLGICANDIFKYNVNATDLIDLKECDYKMMTKLKEEEFIYDIKFLIGLKKKMEMECLTNKDKYFILKYIINKIIEFKIL